jgi:hypothetical protein
LHYYGGNLKGKTLLVVVNKLFIFTSIERQSKAKHDFFSFISGLAEWAGKTKIQSLTANCCIVKLIP